MDQGLGFNRGIGVAHAGVFSVSAERESGVPGADGRNVAGTGVAQGLGSCELAVLLSID